MKKLAPLSSKALSISFWSILIIILIVQWISNNTVISDMSDFTIYVSVHGIGTVLLAITIALLARSLSLSFKARVLWLIAGLFPFFAVFLSFFLSNIGGLGYVILELLLTGPAGFEWMGGTFLFVLLYTLIYFALIAKPVIKRHRPALSSLTIGVAGLVGILLISLIHALAPTPADIAVGIYIQKDTPEYSAGYTVEDVRWYHRCCDETVHTTGQRANIGIYVINVHTEGVTSVRYYILGDGNRDNEFNVMGGHQDWIVTAATQQEVDLVEQRAE